mmetsp:Transcript_67147/g.154202  ORF Transcript_67147/g.154202 Transcript_67147/m.154202 type:complete len:238 (-) Transcript_67147:136-849(-)
MCSPSVSACCTSRLCFFSNLWRRGAWTGGIAATSIPSVIPGTTCGWPHLPPTKGEYSWVFAWPMLDLREVCWFGDKLCARCGSLALLRKSLECGPLMTVCLTRVDGSSMKNSCDSTQSKSTCMPLGGECSCPSFRSCCPPCSCAARARRVPPGGALSCPSTMRPSPCSEQRSGLSERTEWKVLLDAPELRRRSLTGVVRSGDMLREPPLLLMAGLRVPGCVFAGDRSRNRSRWASGK